jgi:hypothetical protein
MDLQSKPNGFHMHIYAHVLPHKETYYECNTCILETINDP